MDLLRVVSRMMEVLERGVERGEDEDTGFHDGLVTEGNELAELIHDPSARRAVVAGVGLVHSYRLIRKAGRGDALADSETGHQWETLRMLRNAAGALARRDPIDPEVLAWLLDNGAELDAAWEDHFAEHEAWKRDNMID